MSKRNRRPDKGRPGSRRDASNGRGTEGGTASEAERRAQFGGFVRSPVSGEIGGGTVWIRLTAGTLGMSTPSLFVDQRDLSTEDLAAEGFERVGDRDATTPVPAARQWGLDLSSRHDADIVRFLDGPAGPGTVPHRIAGSAFPDPHPDPWWQFGHSEGAMPIIVGDPIPFINDEWPTDMESWVQDLWLAHLPLTVRAWAHGVGTARPDQL